mmetsp:Transcript_44158/g.99790  ORF Transcript_44158/g.99790 Transcript_44158/m.99790 type:complete len:396 (+) Transcript_44158:122-1309(+)
MACPDFIRPPVSPLETSPISIPTGFISFRFNLMPPEGHRAPESKSRAFLTTASRVRAPEATIAPSRSQAGPTPRAWQVFLRHPSRARGGASPRSGESRSSDAAQGQPSDTRISRRALQWNLTEGKSTVSQSPHARPAPPLDPSRMPTSSPTACSSAWASPRTRRSRPHSASKRFSARATSETGSSPLPLSPLVSSCATSRPTHSPTRRLRSAGTTLGTPVPACIRAFLRRLVARPGRARSRPETATGSSLNFQAMDRTALPAPPKSRVTVSRAGATSWARPSGNSRTSRLHSSRPKPGSCRGTQLRRAHATSLRARAAAAASASALASASTAAASISWFTDASSARTWWNARAAVRSRRATKALRSASSSAADPVRRSASSARCRAAANRVVAST